MYLSKAFFKRRSGKLNVLCPIDGSLFVALDLRSTFLEKSKWAEDVPKDAIAFRRDKFPTRDCSGAARNRSF